MFKLLIVNVLYTQNKFLSISKCTYINKNGIYVIVKNVYKYFFLIIDSGLLKCHEIITNG